MKSWRQHPKDGGGWGGGGVEVHPHRGTWRTRASLLGWPIDQAAGGFYLICNAQRRVSTRPSHAPASSRHLECTRGLKPIMPQPSRHGPTRRPPPSPACRGARPKRKNGGTALSNFQGSPGRSLVAHAVWIPSSSAHRHDPRLQAPPGLSLPPVARPSRCAGCGQVLPRLGASATPPGASCADVDAAKLM
jgi:hypothetical protein